MNIQQAVAEVTAILQKFTRSGSTASLVTWGEDSAIGVGFRVAEINFDTGSAGECCMQDDVVSGSDCFWVERAVVYRLLAATGGITAQDSWDADWRMVLTLFGQEAADQFEKET